MFFSAAKSTRLLYLFIASAAFTIFYSSCTTVKNYPANKPFVYESTINLVGKFKPEDKKQLKTQLFQQLDDSIAVHKQQKFLFWQTLKNPPVYDSSNAQKSVGYQRALLHSLGYYRDSITYDTSLVIKGDQYRTTVTFNVNPGKLIRLDSIWYNMHDSANSSRSDTLQKITERAMDKPLIKKGDPFSKPLLSSELDRLSDLYRNNGYLLFTRDELRTLWDTVGLALLRPTLDPIEQAQQLEALRRRRENPTADVEIRLRPDIDSNKLTQYYVGTVKIYPDFTGEPTTDQISRIDTLTRFGMQFISYEGLFKPRKLIHYNYMRRGDLYQQSNYLKTQNKFNSIGAWKLVSMTQIPRHNQDTVDIEIRLNPARKYAFSANLEASKNQGNLYYGQGNLIGLAVSFGLVNRNFAKAANQATTNVRFGTELGSGQSQGVVQTLQMTAGHTISFPRLVPRFRKLSPTLRENARTLLSVNFGMTDRLNYYNVKSFATSWGYETSWRKNFFSWRIPNIEYNFLERRQLLNSLINQNASYKYIFNDGLILSTIASFRKAGGNNKTTNLFSISVEPSGILAGFIRSPFLDSNLYRFVKVDAEFSQTHKINRRTVFAWRFFAGVGYELPSKYNRNNKYLPFFRAYYAGGPNSMRAWAIRRLGPGSAIRSFNQDIAPDRFGDMRLELNAEYRFYLTQLFGYNLEGALFTDMGNVWFIRKNEPDFVNGEFQIKNLWRDLAIGSGTGVRIDFSFIKLRLDYAFKVKNPTPDITEASSQNKWFYNWKPFNGQLQLGIDYPF